MTRFLQSQLMERILFTMIVVGILLGIYSVYKVIAINIALMTARRERWRGKSLDQVTFSDTGTTLEAFVADKSSGETPDRSAMQNEISDTLREVIERDLTDKQRQVLMLMVFYEVPMDEVVQRMATNRNAIYKLLHDARRKLKKGLQSRGFEIGETLKSFSEPG